MKLAIFIPSFGDGGVERMLVNMACGLSARDVTVDFLVRSTHVPYLNALPSRVRLLELGTSHPLLIHLRLIRYLRRHRPDWVLAGKDRAGRTALLCQRLSQVPFRLVMRPGTTISQRLAGRGVFKRWRIYRSIRRLYRQADAVVANSRGVAEDISSIANIPIANISVIRNPVITPQLSTLAAQPPTLPGFGLGDTPTILGAGGLRRQKGFDTLIRAFALIQRQQPCRLVILGKGRLLGSLQRLAADLGVMEAVHFPGFVENPYPYMARARLFVLSSRWEGSPNVLCEALALGTPVVATDCRSGPREILQDGRYGPLVPVDDVDSLTQAMLETLRQPPAADFLTQAVREYTIEENARRYEELLRRPFIRE